MGNQGEVNDLGMTKGIEPSGPMEDRGGKIDLERLVPQNFFQGDVRGRSPDSLLEGDRELIIIL